MWAYMEIYLVPLQNTYIKLTVSSWLKSKDMVINLLLITQSSLSEELFEVGFV